jgi:hypothetical protein
MRNLHHSHLPPLSHISSKPRAQELKLPPTLLSQIRSSPKSPLKIKFFKLHSSSIHPQGEYFVHPQTPLDFMMGFSQIQAYDSFGLGPGPLGPFLFVLIIFSGLFILF